MTKGVEWKDLVAYKQWEVVKELALPFPWLIMAFVFGSNQQYFFMALCVVYVFMLGLRIGHNAFHATLGLSKKINHWVMLILSLFLLGSAHAIRYTHIEHHKNCMSKNDVEGHLAKLSFWRALCRSPVYPFYIHIAALQGEKGANLTWIKWELCLSLVVQMIMIVLLDNQTFKIYAFMMLTANCFAPMIGIWAVHRGCDKHEYIARSCRNSWLNYITFGMFYHLEHHMYPAVPTCHMKKLAKRMDEANKTDFLHVV